MNKHRNFAKQTAAEWKARGFKSSTAQEEPSEATDDNAFSKAEASIKKVKRKINSEDAKSGTEGRTDPPKKKMAKPSGTESLPEKPKKPKVNPDGPLKKKKVAKTGTVSASPGEKPKKKIKKPATQSTEAAADGSEPALKKKKKSKAEKSDETTNEEETKKPVPKRKKQKFRSYSLFIGNLSYQTTKEQITEHFKKAGPIKEVRMITNPETNESRGFAYLDVEDNVTYENVLGLHHTFLNRRRINVECTFGGSQSSLKRKSLIRNKTLKLRFLQREGKISSTKQRSWGKYTKSPNGTLDA